MSIFVVCLFFLDSAVTGLEPPAWRSEWHLMRSQSETGSFLELQHGLGELPLKVKVLVTPTSGPNKDTMFEASTAQTDDDDQSRLYCGVLYLYDDTSVRLYAPNKHDGYPSGRIFCTGDESWTDGRAGSGQDTDEAMVKVLVWRESDFPAPDVAIDWTAIRNTAPHNYAEISHGLGSELTFAHLQIRCTIATSYVYGEGTGSDGVPAPGTQTQVSGVLFGYHPAGLFRVWAQESDGNTSPALLGVTDGWGPSTLAQSSCTRGEFRIYGWRTLGAVIKKTGFYLRDDVDVSAIVINPRLWDMERDFISIQVWPLDNSASSYAFSFQARGQTQTTGGSGVMGGINFGYDTGSVRMFTPRDDKKAVVHVTNIWGPEAEWRVPSTIYIYVRIWGSTTDSPTGTSRTMGFRVSPPTTPCPHDILDDILAECAALCAEVPECVGFARCPDTDNACSMVTAIGPVLSDYIKAYNFKINF